MRRARRASEYIRLSAASSRLMVAFAAFSAMRCATYARTTVVSIAASLRPRK